MLLKYSLLTINSSLNCCKDIFLHLKYFAYFNYFSTLFFINYIYYKFTHKLNIRLLNQLHYSINLNGCILIKFFQWIYTNINILTINNVENFDYLHILLGKFSENCPKHSIEYTKKIFKQDFNIDMDDVFDLDESYSIKSASVAQVYKAKLKNNSTNLHLNNFGNFDISNNIAIKIVHPELKYQKIMPMIFIKIYSFLTKYIYFIYKYIPYIDLDLFLKNLLNQFNMNNEYNNINYFYNTFIDNDYVLIPKPICCSKNILIMEFIDGEDFDNLDETELTKQKIVILLNLFIKYNFFISDKYHCDLHNGNWKVQKYKDFYKIIIYDFGYVGVNNNHNVFKKITFYQDLNDFKSLGKLLSEHVYYFNNEKINDINIFSDEFNDYVNYYKKQKFDIVRIVYNFLFYKKLQVNSYILELIISTILIKNQLTAYVFPKLGYTNPNDTIKINLIYINFMEKYNIFPELIEEIKTSHIENDLFKEQYKYENKYFEKILDDFIIEKSDNTYNSIDI